MPHWLAHYLRVGQSSNGGINILAEVQMSRLLPVILSLAILLPAPGWAWEASGEKILSRFTKTAILSDYYMEEVQDVPSTASFIVDGKKLNLVADAEDIEKWLKGKKGRKFQITYGKVDGWVGDSPGACEVLMNARLLK